LIALRVLPEAEEELAHAAEWYESKRGGLGIELVAVVDAALDEIRDAPAACPLWRDGRPYRRKVLTRFPYSVVFRVAGCRRDHRDSACETAPGVLGRSRRAVARMALSDLLR
jgi:hypothetical protein